MHCAWGLWAGLPLSARVFAASPSFDCTREVGSVEQLICADAELADRDRELAEVYAATRRKAVNEHPALLTTEQRGWIKGRNDCWKSDDPRRCVADSSPLEFMQRLAALVPRSRLNLIRFHTHPVPSG